MESATPAKNTEAQLHFLDYWRILRVRKVLILVVFLLVVTSTTVITFWLPKSYLSSANIVVDKDVTDVETVLGNKVQMGFDIFFINTQFERIQSAEVLHRVIEDKELNLNERWTRRFGLERPLETRETYQILSKRLKLRNIRNSSVIEIAVISEDPKEAADIANKIAETYRDLRQERVNESNQAGIKQYREEREKQDQQIKRLQDELDRLRRESGISDIMADSVSVSTLQTETLRRSENERLTAQAQYVTLKTKLDNLQKLPPDQLPEGLNQMQYDDGLASLLKSRDDYLQQLAIKQKELTPEHVDVAKLLAALEVNNKRILVKVDSITNAIAAQVQAAKATYDLWDKAVVDAKQQDLDMQAKLGPYSKVKRELENATEMKRLFEIKTRDLELEANLGKKSMVEIYQRAEPALKAHRPNKRLNIAFGIVIGAIVGIGLAFFVEYLDTSMKTIDDVEAVLQAPVVGVIPQNVGPLLEDAADSPHAEAYRVLRTNVLFGRKDERLNTLTVVSGGAGEGKSTTIFNLAAIFATNGHRVLLVDTDLRRPSLHKILNLSNSIGLTTHLLEQRPLEEVIHSTPIKGLDFLPSGRLNNSSMGVLSSPQMREFIRQVKERYDFVFFDAPPILGVSDASILVSQLDMTLLVIQYRKYPQAMTVRGKLTVDKVGGNLVGVVLNNINLSQDAYYYYSSGYYYQAAPEAEPAGSRPAAGPEGRAPEKPAVKSKY